VKLRDLCFISREGVSLLGISETGESVELHTMAGKFTFENIEKNIL
jgi:hypothetical protein